MDYNTLLKCLKILKKKSFLFNIGLQRLFGLFVQPHVRSDGNLGKLYVLRGRYPGVFSFFFRAFSSQTREKWASPAAAAASFTLGQSLGILFCCTPPRSLSARRKNAPIRARNFRLKSNRPPPSRAWKCRIQCISTPLNERTSEMAKGASHLLRSQKVFDFIPLPPPFIWILYAEHPPTWGNFPSVRTS